MKTQHTPGPWQIIRNKYCVGISNSVGKWKLADVSFIPSVPVETCEANASLIAAAPDLLAALEDAHALLHGPVSDLLTGDRLAESSAYKVMEIMCAAIARATGESEGSK